MKDIKEKNISFTIPVPKQESDNQNMRVVDVIVNISDGVCVSGIHVEMKKDIFEKVLNTSQVGHIGSNSYEVIFPECIKFKCDIAKTRISTTIAFAMIKYMILNKELLNYCVNVLHINNTNKQTNLEQVSIEDQKLPTPQELYEDKIDSQTKYKLNVNDSNSEPIAPEQAKQSIDNLMENLKQEGLDFDTIYKDTKSPPVVAKVSAPPEQPKPQEKPKPALAPKPAPAPKQEAPALVAQAPATPDPFDVPDEKQDFSFNDDIFNFDSANFDINGEDNTSF